MSTSLRYAVLLSTVLLWVVGCQRKSEPSGRAVEPDTPEDWTVPFEITQVSSPKGVEQWLATYSASGKIAKFRIEFQETKPAGDKDFSFSFGKGKLLSEAGSDPSAFLQTLKKALEAKNLPAHVQRAKELPFEFALLGVHQSRSPDGGFSDKPPGDWRAMKIFFGDDEAEVFLNANPVIGKAEFSMKDADYGDRVLEELAKIL